MTLWDPVSQHHYKAKAMQQYTHKKSGFTLVELLVVLVAVGMIVGSLILFYAK